VEIAEHIDRLLEEIRAYRDELAGNETAVAYWHAQTVELHKNISATTQLIEVLNGIQQQDSKGVGSAENGEPAEDKCAIIERRERFRVEQAEAQRQALERTRITKQFKGDFDVSD
jgi:hypothetical protein